MSFCLCSEATIFQFLGTQVIMMFHKILEIYLLFTALQ